MKAENQGGEKPDKLNEKGGGTLLLEGFEILLGVKGWPEKEGPILLLTLAGAQLNKMWSLHQPTAQSQGMSPDTAGNIKLENSEVLGGGE